MKSLNFLSLAALAISTFGLISCSSDKSSPSNSADPFKIANEIQFQDLKGELASHDINSQKPLDLGHQIIFKNKGSIIDESKEINLTIESVCSNEGRILSKTLETKLVPSLKLMEILPDDFLLPSENEKGIWSCNLNFVATNAHEDQHRFDISPLLVEPSSEAVNTEIYYNEKPVTEADSSRNWSIEREELASYQVLSKISEIEEMRLVCREFTVPLFDRGDFQRLDRVALAENESTFETNIIQDCRIHTIKAGRLVGLSKQFKMYLKEMLLGLSLEVTNPETMSFKPHPRSQIHAPELILKKVRVTNTSSIAKVATVTFQGESPVQISALNLQGRSRSPWKSLRQKVRWSAELGEGQSQVQSQSGSQWEVLLQPNAGVEFEVAADLFYNCGIQGKLSGEDAIMVKIPPVSVSSKAEIDAESKKMVDLDSSSSDSMEGYYFNEGVLLEQSNYFLWDVNQIKTPLKMSDVEALNEINFCTFY